MILQHSLGVMLLLLFRSYPLRRPSCPGLRIRLLSPSRKYSDKASSSSGEVVTDSNSSVIKEAKKERVKTTADLRWGLRAVGFVESPYKQKFGIPRQPTIAANRSIADLVATPIGAPVQNSSEFPPDCGYDGRLVLFPEFRACIAHLDGFDYVWVISLFHLNSGFKTKIRPQPAAYAERRPPAEVGLFASRAPHRPNPIALSALKVVAVDLPNGIVYVKGIDLLHDTPILDIKPYIPAFDAFPDAKAGWMDLITTDRQRARESGYQNIKSPRGARQGRAIARRRISETVSNQSNGNSEHKSSEDWGMRQAGVSSLPPSPNTNSLIDSIEGPSRVGDESHENPLDSPSHARTPS